jgi:hypothetical protein
MIIERVVLDPLIGFFRSVISEIPDTTGWTKNPIPNMLNEMRKDIEKTVFDLWVDKEISTDSYESYIKRLNSSYKRLVDKNV